jgi:endonuclease/exonuclease/phosphatase family metal-dependent hydrolase
MILRIRTWNCFGMAQGTLHALFAQRATAGERLLHPEVARECSATDVFCTQEIMSADTERFFDGLSELVARHRDHNRFDWRTGTVRGTGLGIAMRASPSAVGVRHFARPASGWDRFARKGTMHARVPVGDAAVDVVTVHLQAGWSPGDLAVRARQLASLPALVAELGADDRPFVIAGDLNIQGLAQERGAEYAALMAALAGFEDLGAVDDLPTFDPHEDGNALAREYHPDAGPHRIDYVLVRAPKRGPRMRVRSLTRFFDRPLAPNGASNGAPMFASDHYGVAAELDIE